MPVAPLFDDYDLTEPQIRRLVAYYRAAETRLLKVVRGIVPAPSFDQSRAYLALRQIREIVDDLDTRANAWTPDAVRKAMLTGANAAGRRLISEGVIDYADMRAGALIPQDAVKALAMTTAVDLSSANESIRKSLIGYIMATRQAVIEEDALTGIVAEGIIEGAERKTVSRRIADALAARMEDGRLVAIRARNGATLHYEIDTYAEMVARTRTREAVTQGIILTSAKFGNDLVQISVHSGACSKCLPYQGRVYSLSGASKDFPMLDARPPFHPDCRHVLTPVVESAMRASGEYESLAAFTRDAMKHAADYDDYRRTIDARMIAAA
jgi:hypothetical protein